MTTVAILIHQTAKLYFRRHRWLSCVVENLLRRSTLFFLHIMVITLFIVIDHVSDLKDFPIFLLVKYILVLQFADNKQRRSALRSLAHPSVHIFSLGSPAA